MVRRHLLENAASQTRRAHGNIDAGRMEMVYRAKRPNRCGSVPNGCRLYEDGGQIVSSTDGWMRLRRKWLMQAMFGVSVVVNTNGKIRQRPGGLGL